MKLLKNNIRDIIEPRSRQNITLSVILNANSPCVNWHIRPNILGNIWFNIKLEIVNNIKTNVKHKEIAPETKSLIEFQIKNIGK